MAKRDNNATRFWIAMLALLGFSGVAASAQQPPKRGGGAPQTDGRNEQMEPHSSAREIMVMYGPPTMNYRVIAQERELANLKEQVRRKRVELQSARQRLKAKRKEIRLERKLKQNKARR